MAAKYEPIVSDTGLATHKNVIPIFTSPAKPNSVGDLGLATHFSRVGDSGLATHKQELNTPAIHDSVVENDSDNELWNSDLGVASLQSESDFDVILELPVDLFKRLESLVLSLPP